MTAGARIRTDIVDVYVFRAQGDADAVEFLQLRRTRPPMLADWHPVMGHTRAGETALDCALRELQEEVGLDARSDAALGLWQLEQVRPYFLVEQDAIVLSPRFAARVGDDWTPRLDDEHDAHRWVPMRDVDTRFRWPGQRGCCREIAGEIVARAAYEPLSV